jgi:hypothetical protein
MPTPHEEKVLGGPLAERAKRRLVVLIKKVLMVPYWIFTLPFRQLRGEILSMRSAAVESIAFVGVELRRLSDLIEAGGGKPAGARAGTAPRQNGEATALVEAPLVFRSLTGLESPASVLIIGSNGHDVGASLASFGHRVTILDPGGATPSEDPQLEVVAEPLSDWDPGDRRFQAILQMGETEQPDPAVVQRITELLASDGILVITRGAALVPAGGEEPKS